MGADTATVDRIIARQRAANTVEAAQMVDMLGFVDVARDRGAHLGGKQAGTAEASSAAHELSLAVRVPVAVLERRLADARRARSVLPAVWQAWIEGQIDGQKVAAIVEASRVLQQPDSIIELDGTVAPIAGDKTLGQLRAWLRRFCDRIEAGSSQRRHEIGHRDRRVQLEHGTAGMSWLMALIPTLSAASIDQRLDDIARDINSRDHDDKRTCDQVRADTLCELLTDATTDTIGESKISIGVTVPIQSLLGLSDAPGELIDRSAGVPASLIRAKAIQPGTIFWRLLTDKRGHLLDVTKIGRHAPADIGMAIRFRDGTSVFPTAAVPAKRCDLDHTIAHPGGPTTAANLGALHRRAHNLKTAGLLSVRQPEAGNFEWTTSTGHRYLRKPQPFPSPGWDEKPCFDPAFLDANDDDNDDRVINDRVINDPAINDGSEPENQGFISSPTMNF